MKTSKIISLAAVTAALAIIFLTIGVYVDVMDLSCLFMASLVIMLPLSKESVKCSLLGYGGAAIISAFICASTGRFAVCILFAAFFGLHPIINYLETSKNWNKALLLVIKDVWFVLTCLLMYYVFNLFTDLPDIVEQYAVYFIIIGGAILFVPYDMVMKRFQTLTDALIKRLKI